MGNNHSRYCIIVLVLLVVLFSNQDVSNAQPELTSSGARIDIEYGDNNQFPHFVLKVPSTEPAVIDLNGWDVGGNFSEISRKKIWDTIKSAYDANFNIIYLRVDWASIEPVQNQLTKGNLNKIKEILDEISSRNSKEESGHQVRVIIALELDTPPEWFREGSPGSLIMHLNRYDETSGPMGQIKNDHHYEALNFASLNDPEYQKAVVQIINDIVIQLKKHPALFGWALTSPSSPLWYPGAGKDEAGGFADYSNKTVSLFLEKHNIVLDDNDDYPFLRGSQPRPDFRPNWLTWDKFRIDQRRKAVDKFGALISKNDLHHPIFVMFWGVMAYEGDNGYRSQVWGNDYFYQLTQPYVNGVLIPFQLSSKTFDYPSGKDDMDSLHQLTTAVEMAQRHGKVPLLMVEKSWRNPPSTRDIDTLAYLAVTLGTDIIWSSKGMSQLSPGYTAKERATIERTSHLTKFPYPDSHQVANIAILDYPFELSKFYCENNMELHQSLAILDAFQDAGFHFSVVTPDEIFSADKPDPANISPESFVTPPSEFELYDIANDDPEWKKDIISVAPLADSMSTYLPDKVKQFYKKLGQEGMKPYKLEKYLLDAFISQDYDNAQVRGDIRNQLKKQGIKYHWLNTNKCYIVVNLPYIFIKFLKKNPNSPDLKIILDQYNIDDGDLKDSGSISFYDVYNDRNLNNIEKYAHISGEMDYILPNDRLDTVMLVKLPVIQDFREDIILHKKSIEHFHRVSAMKRSMPVALILTVITITLGVVFTIQLYHPTVVKRRRKKRRRVPVLHDHEDYFTSDDSKK